MPFFVEQGLTVSSRVNFDFGTSCNAPEVLYGMSLRMTNMMDFRSSP